LSGRMRPLPWWKPCQGTQVLNKVVIDNIIINRLWMNSSVKWVEIVVYEICLCVCCRWSQDNLLYFWIIYIVYVDIVI
jgi:hypothetical protein